MNKLVVDLVVAAKRVAWAAEKSSKKV